MLMELAVERVWVAEHGVVGVTPGGKACINREPAAGAGQIDQESGLDWRRVATSNPDFGPKVK